MEMCLNIVGMTYGEAKVEEREHKRLKLWHTVLKRGRRAKGKRWDLNRDRRYHSTEKKEKTMGKNRRSCVNLEM